MHTLTGGITAGRDREIGQFSFFTFSCTSTFPPASSGHHQGLVVGMAPQRGQQRRQEGAARKEGRQEDRRKDLRKEHPNNEKERGQPRWLTTTRNKSRRNGLGTNRSWEGARDCPHEIRRLELWGRGQVREAWKQALRSHGRRYELNSGTELQLQPQKLQKQVQHRNVCHAAIRFLSCPWPSSFSPWSHNSQRIHFRSPTLSLHPCLTGLWLCGRVGVWAGEIRVWVNLADA